jgi:thiamine-phosphate pyrophosphorylase
MEIRKALPQFTGLLLGIGGITSENVGDVMAAGADGVAVISAILGAADVRRAAQELRAAMASAVAAKR